MIEPRRRARPVSGRAPSWQGGVVLVSGELDAATGPALARRLRAQRAVRVLDLSAVTFIDAAGLSWLRESLRRARGHVIVGGISAGVHRLLDVAGLDVTVLVPPVAATTERPRPVRRSRPLPPASRTARTHRGSRSDR